MSRLIIALSALSALTLTPALHAAEIVKLVDPSGRVIYADRALKGTRVVGTVDSEPAVSAGAARRAGEAIKADASKSENSKSDGAQSDNAKADSAKSDVAPAPRAEATKADTAKATVRGRTDTKLARAEPSARQEIRWMGAEPDGGRRTLNSAYTELEAATAARDAAERELRDAIVPRAGETVQHADGNPRFLPIYYERVAPFERAAILAQDRFERAQAGFRGAR